MEFVSPTRPFKSVGGTRKFSDNRDARREFVYAGCMSSPTYMRAQTDGVLLSIKLQPRASANEIGEPLGGELRIKVTAPPVDSAANEALIELLAETLDCARGRVELVRGQTSRHKVVAIRGLTVEEALKKLSA
jgi:uncharacterized protein (TIGR00251 family)